MLLWQAYGKELNKTCSVGRRPLSHFVFESCAYAGRTVDRKNSPDPQPSATCLVGAWRGPCKVPTKLEHPVELNKTLSADATDRF